MTENGENLVLEMLRGMRATLDQHSTEFTRLHKRLDDMHETMIPTLGLAGHANILHDRAAAKFAAVESELAELRARIERLENAT